MLPARKVTKALTKTLTKIMNNDRLRGIQNALSKMNHEVSTKSHLRPGNLDATLAKLTIASTKTS